MAENLNNNEIDFYRNQIPPNQGNLTNVVLRQERKEASFEVGQNFLESSFNKFLEQKFQQIQTQVPDQLQNVLRVMGQQIIDLRNYVDNSFTMQDNKINCINAGKEEVNEKCKQFYSKWEKEDSKNKEYLDHVYKVMDESNNRISNEINCQSKKLDESIQKNKIENDKFKNDFKILKNDLNLAHNKNNGNENLIKNLTENFNDSNKRIIDLKTRLIKLENLYKNNNELSKIKTNINNFEIQIQNNLNNISDLEKNFTKYKETNDKNFKELQGKINDANEQLYNKFEEITKEINKLKNDLLNKKFESIKLKNNTSYNEILDNIKNEINEFIENNNKEVEEIKSKQKKDIENLNIQIKKDLDKLNNECNNKMENNLKLLKNNFEKIERDFKNQYDINTNYKNSLDDIIKKIENTKIIMQNKNDNKNKINIENKKIEKYEMINDKLKIYKMSQWYNQISFQDITNECEEDKINKTIEKIKILFKKDEEENDKIIYEVSNLYKEWDFKRHIINLFKRINKAKEIKRINLNKLKYVYILKFTDNQIHFIKKEAILNFVKNNNFYVKIGNNFVFVNNKRRKLYNNRKWNNRNFSYRKNNFINKNGNIKNNNSKNNNLNRRNNINNFNNNKSINQAGKFSDKRNQSNNNKYINDENRRFNKFKGRKNFNNKNNYNNRNKFNEQNF